MDILTFQGAEMDDVLDYLKAIVLRNDAGNLHTLRIAIDGGTLKIKANEFMWSPPIKPTANGPY